MSERERGPGTRRTACWLTRRQGRPQAAQAGTSACAPAQDVWAPLHPIGGLVPRGLRRSPHLPFHLQGVYQRERQSFPGCGSRCTSARKPAGSPAGGRAPLRVTAALPGRCRPRPLCPLSALSPKSSPSRRSLLPSCAASPGPASPRGPCPEGSCAPGSPGLCFPALRTCCGGARFGTSEDRAEAVASDGKRDGDQERGGVWKLLPCGADLGLAVLL